PRRPFCFHRSHRPALPYAFAVRLQPHPRRHAPLVSRRALCPPRRTRARTPPTRGHRRRPHHRFSRRNRRRSRRHVRLHRAPPLHLSPRFLFLEAPGHQSRRAFERSPWRHHQAPCPRTTRPRRKEIRRLPPIPNQPHPPRPHPSSFKRVDG